MDPAKLRALFHGGSTTPQPAPESSPAADTEAAAARELADAEEEAGFEGLDDDEDEEA